MRSGGNMLVEAAAVLLLAGLVAGAQAWFFPPQWSAGGGPGRISREEARALSPPALWVDARTEAEFARGHVPGAVRVGPESFEEAVGALLEQWSPGRPVVVYCGAEGCDRSEVVARRLREEFLLEPVYVLAGGWAEMQGARP